MLFFSVIHKEKYGSYIRLVFFGIALYLVFGQRGGPRLSDSVTKLRNCLTTEVIGSIVFRSRLLCAEVLKPDK